MGYGKTNWYVITGGPCVGKTTLLNALKSRGFKTVSEAARNLIDYGLEQGKTLKEVRGDVREFQEAILKMKLETEKNLSHEDLTFFDVGMADSIAYYKLHKMDASEVVKVTNKHKYKGIFLLERGFFEKDYARMEDEKIAKAIDKLIAEAYSKLNYSIVRVPFLPIEERISLILDKVKND